jgi:hypothetical protein
MEVIIEIIIKIKDQIQKILIDVLLQFKIENQHQIQILKMSKIKNN